MPGATGSDLRGRTVAITGGARGIGRAIAAQLAGAGARVAIGDVDLAAAERTAAELGQNVVALDVDVSDRASMDRFVDGAEEALGPLDVMVNNAGILLVGPFLEEDDAATERQLAVNVMGVVHGMRAALPRMRERGRGQVVNVASSASWIAPPNEVTYAATKHAVLALSDGVRLELAGSGVIVTAVYPGLVETELSRGTHPPRATRLITPEEVAAAVLRGIRERRSEVFVPRELAAILRANRMATSRARILLARAFGLGQLTNERTGSDRVGYMRRIGLRPDQAGAEPSGSDGGEAERAAPADTAERAAPAETAERAAPADSAGDA